MSEYIPLDECKEGYVYFLHSRNLSVGVFDGRSGFIGIRSKFESTYLFTEYHWDTGAPYGTVRPKQELGKLRDGADLTTSLGTVDKVTNRLVFYDDTPDENGKGTQQVSGGQIRVKGWCYEDTKEPVPDGCRPTSVGNKKLFRRMTYWGKKAKSLERSQPYEGV
jgi:hypothetical protein